MTKKINDNEVTGLAVVPATTTTKGASKSTPIDFVANYYAVMLSPGQVIYEYLANFNCDLGLRRKVRILEGHKEFGVIATDGIHLYSPRKLPTLSFEFATAGGEVRGKVRLTPTKELKGNNPDIWRVFNIVKGGLLKKVGLKQLGRNYFRMDDKDAITVPGVYNISFFPGVSASVVPVQSYGAALVADVLYKAVRKDTAYDLIEQALEKSRGIYREGDILKSVVGKSVITTYRKQPYVIDDVDFTKTPLSTFEWKSAADKPAEPISYVEYVKKCYGDNASTKVTDMKQPLLVVYRRSGEKTYLIPELCRMTGIPDEMRKDNKTMKCVADATHPDAPKHAEEISRYARVIGRDSSAVGYMRPWGMALSDTMLPVKGAVLPQPKIVVGRGKRIPGGYFDRKSSMVKPDFSRDLGFSVANVPVSLSRWMCVIPSGLDGKGNAACNDFVYGHLIPELKRLCGGGEKSIAEPIWVECDFRDQKKVQEAIRRSIAPQKPEFAVIVFRNENKDLYNAAKRGTYADLGDIAFPTQVFKLRTISNTNIQKLSGVTKKAAVQIVAKLGGVAYSVEVADPALRDGTMLVGIDVCHKGSAFARGEKRSVVGLVATVDNTFVRCYADTRIQEHRKEIVDDLTSFVENAIAAYRKKNGSKFPKQVIVYRDGVGDGQLSIVRDNEVRQFQDAFNRMCPDKAKQPKLVFIVVKKNTTTRLFSKAGMGNPPAGSVVDSGITHNGWYEFFLVPHFANQGMISPTNFVVVRDDLGVDKEVLETFTFHQCFVYQNWSGSIKVPGVCQNAHKMAYLVGENIGRELSNRLSDKQAFL